MLLIPLPFLTAAVMLTLLLAVRSNRKRQGRQTAGFIDLFFGLAAVQAVLTGLRYGYQIEVIHPVLPVTAVLLPPLLLLSFERPKLTPSLLIHLVPALLAVMVVGIFPPLLDALVPVVFIFYAVLLARLSTGPEDAMPWARLDNITGSRFALWIMVVSLVLSALTDILIAIDFARSGGQNVAGISLITQALTVLLIAMLLWRWVPEDSPRDDPEDPTKAAGSEPQSATPSAGLPSHPSSTRTAEDFDIVCHCLVQQALHLDPDLNLQRLARKSGIPGKRLSAAVNSVEGVNVSQWINSKRIEHAQQLLQSPDQRISDIIYSCGFNTKSSFNREFKRITGVTPSAWRDSLVGS